MQIITFENLPIAVSELHEKLNRIESLLLQQNGEQSAPAQDELLTVEDAAKFLSLSKPTIYGLIHKGALPVMKRSKRCYFSKADLMNYLKAGRKRSNDELESEAANHSGKKR